MELGGNCPLIPVITQHRHHTGWFDSFVRSLFSSHRSLPFALAEAGDHLRGAPPTATVGGGFPTADSEAPTADGGPLKRVCVSRPARSSWGATQPLWPSLFTGASSVQLEEDEVSDMRARASMRQRVRKSSCLWVAVRPQYWPG